MQAITVFGIETPDRHGQWRNCQFACRPLPFSVLKLARRFGFYCYHSSLHAGHYRFRYFAQSRNPVSFFRTQGFFRMKRAQARLILRCHAPCIRSHPARGTCRASASMWEAAIPAFSVASRSAVRRHGCRLWWTPGSHRSGAVLPREQQKPLSTLRPFPPLLTHSPSYPECLTLRPSRASACGLRSDGGIRKAQNREGGQGLRASSSQARRNDYASRRKRSASSRRRVPLTDGCRARASETVVTVASRSGQTIAHITFASSCSEQGTSSRESSAVMYPAGPARSMPAPPTRQRMSRDASTVSQPPGKIRLAA